MFGLLPLSARVKIGLMENLNRSSLFSFFFRASSLWADSTFRISCARHQLICSCQCYPDNGHEEELFLLFRVDACLVVSGMRMIQSSRIYFNINHSDVLHCTFQFSVLAWMISLSLSLSLLSLSLSLSLFLSFSLSLFLGTAYPIFFVQCSHGTIHIKSPF